MILVDSCPLHADLFAYLSPFSSQWDAGKIFGHLLQRLIPTLCRIDFFENGCRNGDIKTSMERMTKGEDAFPASRRGVENTSRASHHGSAP